MSSLQPATRPPVHTYNDGNHYRIARGRRAPRDDVESNLPSGHSVISGCPSTEEFLRVIHQTLKIRMYATNSRKSYLSYVKGFLRWHGNLPHTIQRQDVCNYLELLVDGGASAAQIAGCLSAIRTCFDKFCGRDITLGLATPRRKKSQPVVPSESEISRILSAAPTHAAKLAIGILYAAGLRNSELCRLQVRDIDFTRNTIRIYQGKGCSDRLVMLPQTWRGSIQELCRQQSGNQWLFPSLQHRKNRHMSPRTLQRWVAIAVDFSGVKKKITPHSFRHAFATHLLEHGTDIRYIQKLLGHQRLETTTIYTKVAQIRGQVIQSPIDQWARQPTLGRSADSGGTCSSAPRSFPKDPPSSGAPPVGTLKIHFQKIEDTTAARVTLEVVRDKSGSVGRRRSSGESLDVERRVFLTGIVVEKNDLNWVQLTMPNVAQWQQPMRGMSKAMVQRIHSPEFYETLRSHICQRFLALF